MRTRTSKKIVAILLIFSLFASEAKAVWIEFSIITSLVAVVFAANGAAKHKKTLKDFDDLRQENQKQGAEIRASAKRFENSRLDFEKRREEFEKNSYEKEKFLLSKIARNKEETEEILDAKIDEACDKKIAQTSLKKKTALALPSPVPSPEINPFPKHSHRWYVWEREQKSFSPTPTPEPTPAPTKKERRTYEKPIECVYDKKMKKRIKRKIDAIFEENARKKAEFNWPRFWKICVGRLGLCLAAWTMAAVLFNDIQVAASILQLVEIAGSVGLTMYFT
jgi:hypothetical protein